MAPSLRGLSAEQADWGSAATYTKMYYNNKNVEYARRLRREMTPWERKLWYCYLNKHTLRFYRQKPIENFIVDFYCPRAKLVIELDGGGHYDPKAEKKDNERTVALEKQGLKVIRFCNIDIDKNFRGVCESIDKEIYNRVTLPQSR